MSDDEYEWDDEDDEDEDEEIDWEEEYEYDEEDCQEYECQNAGCKTSGHSFFHNTEEWFEEKGADAPKNCKPCKRWIRRQRKIGPIDVKCRFCSFHWQIFPYTRIIHHRTKGNWEEYWKDNEDSQICRRCEEFPGRRRKLEYLQARREYKGNPGLLKKADEEYLEREKSGRSLAEYLTEVGISATSKGYDVPSALLFYQGVKTAPHLVDRHGPNQLAHILKVGHHWEEEIGTEDPVSILGIGYRIAISTESHVLQFRDRNMIVKYDTAQEIVVLIGNSKESESGYMIHTTFPKDPKEVIKKIELGEWISEG